MKGIHLMGRLELGMSYFGVSAESDVCHSIVGL